MFTGIVEAVGSVSDLKRVEEEWRLTLDTADLNLTDVRAGDSIAVNGCCLTVVTLAADGFSADVSNETLRCTTLAQLQSGSPVNLEKAMRADSRFGGHMVSGHVDGVGELQAMTEEGKSVRLDFTAPEELSRYIAGKGSICIDGTSLTVNEVSANRFSVNIIPHTQEQTIIGHYRVGQRVNLEVDLIARYLERLMQNESIASGAGGISREFLQEHGFQSS